MATPPASRDEFEVALVCALPLEYNAVSLLFDEFWDENGDPFGRAVGDTNTYTTGRLGNFDVVLVLLPDTGQVSAASATASLRSSYPGLRLVILTGICGSAPNSGNGDEILLGDVIISKTVIQYDYGREYPNDFTARDITEDSLGRPNKNIRTLVTVLETDLARERLEKRAAVLLEQIQDSPTKGSRRKADTYHYPGTVNDKLFRANYRHKHHLSLQCLCAQCHDYGDPVCEESQNLECDVLGCDDNQTVWRQRLETNRHLEQQGRSKEAQVPSIFIGRFGSSDKTLKSGEDRDWIAKRYGSLAFETESAGVWDELPCIIVKGVCNYADSHGSKRWQDFAAATAASVAKSLVERYTKTDKSSIIQIRQQVKEMMEDKESKECLKDIHQTDPRDDKTRIQRTKGDLLKGSYRWILDHVDFKQWRDNPKYRTLWIKGDPGKGKTMLLCGIIDEIEKSTTMHCLSYFFCQATELQLSNATAVVRGLIYMIIIQRPLLISHVREKYDQAGKTLFNDGNAWEALSKMLMAILTDPSLADAILIVDALDECVEGLPLLLQFLTQASHSSHAKWIVSSRNWPLIEESLDATMQGVRLCLELNESSVSAAVETYIRYKVQKLKKEKDYDSTTQEAVEQHLVSNAHGTFLWVALVCQELADPKVRKRHTLHLLNLYPPGLDPLYQRMMENICDSLDADLCRQILAITSVVYRPITVAELNCFIESHYNYDKSELAEIIGSCGSFLTLREGVVYFIHQSVKDFLLGKASDQILASGVRHQHYTIFARSLEILNKTLQRDIWNLCLPGFPIERVSPPDPDPLAPIHYSCIYWADHFGASELPQALNHEKGSQSGDAITIFLKEKYLYWLEALSLLRSMSVGVMTMQKLVEMIQTPQLTELLEDAYRFILSHKRVIESVPLQVYVSALVFSPSHSKVRKHFRAEEPSWVLSNPPMESHWHACLHTLEGHADEVSSVAFSHDSALVASASVDATIRLWRTNTGDCIQELKGHTEMVLSVAFSHNSALIASASADKTIRLWRTNTGDCMQKLEGHTGKILSIAFSRNSALIASASEDATIRLWCTDTGYCVQASKIHYHRVNLVTFSDDSSLIVIVSADVLSAKGTDVCLWRGDAGNYIHVEKLKCFYGEVNSVALSHDLTLIASALKDETVQLWSTNTGDCLQELKGHSDRVTSVAFSHDSTLVASASADKTVRLWRTDTGDCVQELKGYSDMILSATFSHDSKLIASASEDKTVRLWRVNTATHIQEPVALSTHVTSIAFSHNSALVALASEDNEIVTLWCTETGRCMQKLRGYSEGVTLIAFSHDSALIALTSNNNTVRLWCTDTGDCVQELQIDENNWLTLTTVVTFSHDSALIASGSIDGIIRLWRTNTGECIQTLGDHLGMITSVAFSYDSALIASAQFGDKTVRLWCIATGDCIQTLRDIGSLVTSIAFSHNSAFLAIALVDRTVRLWCVDRGCCVQSVYLGVSSKYLSFASDNSRLFTDVGSITIDNTTIPVFRNPTHFSGPSISSDLSWIRWNNNDILKLPVEFQPACSAVLGSTVVIGCASGRVLFICLPTKELSKLYSSIDNSLL